MQKVILTCMVAICATVLCSAKSFNAEGVSFKYDNGWVFNTSVSAPITSITGVKDELSIAITIMPMEKQTVESTLEATIEKVMESTMGNRKIKLKSKTDAKEGHIGAHFAQYADIFFSNKVHKRFYCFEVNKDIVVVTLTCEEKNIEKPFKTILKSFNYSKDARGFF